jgi:2-polyprenyl-3-methyl-5-hydroxy-6-metoxy-1,4-benzoquinol methylase
MFTGTGRRIPCIFELLPRVDGLTCLDLGCSEGDNTRLLAGKGACVAAVDLADSFIAAARQNRSEIC